MHLEPYVFADDAGKWEDRDVICLCAYLFSGERVEDFMLRWSALLSELKMSRLHMTEFYTEAKKRNWDDKYTLEVLSRFAGIIRDCSLITLSVGLDAKHYRSLPKKKTEGVPKPHVMCLQRLLKLIRNRFHKAGYDNRITFVLDEEEGSVVALYKDILGLRKSRPDLGKYIGAVCFADDTFYTQLQAADMLANLTYRYTLDVIAGKTDGKTLPEPLRSLLIDPVTQQAADIEQEAWTAEAINAGLADLLKT